MTSDHRSTPWRAVAPVLMCLALASGCASTGDGNWGAEVTLSPGWNRLADSAINALTSPHVWVPALGAAVFTIGDWDEETLEWATEHTPIFGSVEDAKDWSDDLATLAGVNWFVTGVAAPSGSEQYLANKAKGLGMQALTLAATRSVTSGLKSAVSRERPDRPEKDNSFPSLHTSGAASAAALAARNIDYLDISPGKKAWWQAGSYTVAGLTGWARIEGNRHYPSDVLFGYALGYFMAAFINDAFIMPSAREQLSVSVDSTDTQGLVMSLHYRW